MNYKTKWIRKILLSIVTLLGVYMVARGNIYAAKAPDTITFEHVKGAMYFRDTTWGSMDLWYFYIDPNAQVGYCANYKTQIQGGVHYKKNQYISPELTSVLVNGYPNTMPPSVLNALNGFSRNNVDPSIAQRYATQWAYYKMTGMFPGDNNIGIMADGTHDVHNATHGYPNITDSDKQKVINAANELVNYAKAHPYQSVSNNNTDFYIIQNNAKERFLDTAGNQIIIGPYQIYAPGAGGNTISASVEYGNVELCNASGGGLGALYHNSEVYIKTSSDSSERNAKINFSGKMDGGYEAAIYTSGNAGGQDIVTLYPGEVHKNTSLEIKVTPPRHKLYIRHVDNKGLYEIPCNDYAYEAKGNYTSQDIEQKDNLVKGSTKKETYHGKTVTYQEFYRYHSGNTMKTFRSLVYCKNGYRYIYTGGAMASGSDFNEAYKRFVLPTEDVWKYNTTNPKRTPYVCTNQAPNTNATSTIIEFYYNVYPPETPQVPTDPTPEIEVQPDVGRVTNTTDEGCDMTYTPSGEYVKPYLRTPRYYLDNLTYTIENNKIKLQTLTVNTLSSGTIQDNQDAGAVNGDIIGRGKHTLFNGGENESKRIDISNQLNNQLDKFVHEKSQLDQPIKDIEDIEPVFGVNGNIEKDLKSGASNPNYELTSQLIKGKTYKYYQNLTTVDDFSDSSKQLVPSDRYNGIRQAKGTAIYHQYKVMEGGSRLEKPQLIQEKKKIPTTNKKYINVYTPVSIAGISVESGEIINHTTSDTRATSIIQKNAAFTVSITSGNATGNVYTNLKTTKYIDCYYMMLDIDIKLKSDTTVIDNSGREVIKPKDTILPKYTPIRVPKQGDTSTFSAIATSGNNALNPEDSIGDETSQLSTTVDVVAKANNLSGGDANALTPYVMEREKNKLEANNSPIFNYVGEVGNYVASISNNVCEETGKSKFVSTFSVGKETLIQTGANSKLIEMNNDAYYYGRKTEATTNIGRIYDFKITDCSDINYKNVFRKSVNDKKEVNNLTNICYFSGIKALNIYSSDINTLKNRADVNIPGTATKTILPLGPYKSTQSNYMQAPKMGYRISFDLKTSGKYIPGNPNNKTKRMIVIKPSYYYLSKKGEIKEEITLYYKGSNGKYKRFQNSDYKISFQPNNGYRSLYNMPDTKQMESLSDKLQELNISSPNGFVLDDSMATYSQNGFVQAWYGEFKLPNTTIATTGTHGINNPLTNGYIGVKFDIECVDSREDKTITISYNQNNKQKVENKWKEQPNSTQWDYEQYLGLDIAGKTWGNEEARLQVENGILQIKTQEDYNKIRGTVVLFDLDNRASDDFQ